MVKERAKQARLRVTPNPIKPKNRKADCHPDRKHYSLGYCRECYMSSPERKAQRHAYYLSHLPQYKSYTQQRNDRRSNAARRHGVPWQELRELADSQGNVCAICRKPPKKNGLHVDHNHQTGTIRALLCSGCNTGLGQFRESPEILEKAAQYLRERGHAAH